MTNRQRTCGNACARRESTAPQKRDCRAIMTRLRQVDFAITETVMYLDAYPDCGEAKAFYAKLIAERKQLVAAYETQCGPLTMYGCGDGPWQWTDGPWPWEPEANG